MTSRRGLLKSGSADFQSALPFFKHEVHEALEVRRILTSMDNSSKLPVIGTVSALISHSVGNWKALTVLSVLGGIALQLSAQIMPTFFYLLAPSLGYANYFFGPVIQALAVLLAGLVQCVLAVLWHRLIILKEPMTSAAALQALSSRRYLLCAALLFGVWALYMQFIMLVFRLGALTQPVLIYGFFAAFIICAGRICLAFPAAALNFPEMNFWASYNTTRGSTLRLPLGWLLAMIPLMVVQMLVAWWFRPVGLIGNGNWGLQLLETTLNAASTVVSAGFVSFAYVHFKAAEETRQSTAAQA